ncbi:hypothetical protein [Bacillus paramycoides]|uniref:hypothetical protein n=1 Tax=Bacillus paramycoides TaxID=2026194 RepID=UPI003811B642
MDGQIFANSLVSLKGNDLRMVYALLCKTNIGNLLSAKTKDVFSKGDNNDHFIKYLEEAVKELGEIDDRVIQVNLFLEFAKLLQLGGTKYTVQQEIEEQCTNIVKAVYAKLAKQDKKFCTFIESNPNSTELQQMIQFQMNKIFSELDGKFQDFTIEDQEKFATQVNEYILSLPEEKQIIIKEKLGVNELTDEMIRKAIAAGGTSIVFAIIVEVSGFAFYTTATSLFASFAGLFGLTLPFGFYTGLTSTIAVLASPLFILPLLFGGGVLLVNHQNKSLKEKLLPIVVMQIALPYMSNGEGDSEFNGFIQEWERRYNEFIQLQGKASGIELERNGVHSQIFGTEKIIKDCQEKVKLQEAQIVIKKQYIHADLKVTNLNQLRISESFEQHKSQYENVMAEINKLKTSQHNRDSDGFLNWIGNKISDISTSIDLRSEERKAELILKEMLEDVLVSNSGYKQEECESIKYMHNEIKRLQEVQSWEEKKKQELEAESKRLNQEQNSYLEKIKVLQKENYGLRDLL